MITAEQIKQLREKTDAPISECRKALLEADGDFQKALEILSKNAKGVAQKKSDREIKEGAIESYIHANGKVGVLLELGCETDFVAKNMQFKTLAKEIAMQIAATDPKNEAELLAQPYIRESQKTIGDLINEHIAKFGENIKVGQFSRLAI